MEKIIKIIEKTRVKNPPSNINKIEKIEKHIGFAFPKDYKLFMFFSDGGEGYIGEDYISLWKTEYLLRYNKEYNIQKYLKDNALA